MLHSEIQAPVGSTSSPQGWSILGAMCIKHHSIHYVSPSPQILILKDLRDLETSRKWVSSWHSMTPANPGQKPKLPQAKWRKGLNAILILLCLLHPLSVPSTNYPSRRLEPFDYGVSFPYNFNCSKREEGNSESSNKCFRRSPSSTKDSLYTSHFSFGPFNTPRGSVLFISFYR